MGREVEAGGHQVRPPWHSGLCLGPSLLQGRRGGHPLSQLPGPPGVPFCRLWAPPCGSISRMPSGAGRYHSSHLRGLELLRGVWGYLKKQVQNPEAGAQACPGGHADRVIADHTAKAGRGGPIPVSQHWTAALVMCGQESEVRGLKRRKESQVLPGA